MSPALGNVFLALGLVSAVLSVIALVWGDRLGRKEGEGATNLGYLATFGVALAVTVSTAILLAAFMSEDFGFKYVAENHSTDVSNIAWLFKISGIWAGREGSLLFWEFLLSLFVAWVAYKRLSETDRLSNMSLAVANGIQIFFLVALFIETNNPFATTPLDWLAQDGTLLVRTAMNPLLQHWAMVLHPPTLFIGYAGLAIPFAFAMGALIAGDGSDTWVRLADRISVFAWLFLGIGIGLGAIWAYVVLGWGGYWAWDPVENASLLPWLTGVGLLHSFTVYRRRGGFKRWSVWMASVTFVLVLLGTFITRSGVVQSVHAFEQDPWSLWWFLSMMVLCLVVTWIGLSVRREEFGADTEYQSLLSKETSYYFNNVIMLFSSVFIAYLTLAPALRFLPRVIGGGQSFGRDTYDPLAWGLGVLYVLIMAVCPVLSWKNTPGSTLWERTRVPLGITAVLSVALLAFWATDLRPTFVAEHPDATSIQAFWHNVWAPLGLIVAAFAVAVPLFLFWQGAKKRSEARGEPFATALFNLFAKARQQSGGYLTHLGVGIILMGLIGSGMWFVRDVKTVLPDTPGQSFEVLDYTFTYQGLREETKPNGDVETYADFQVTKGGRDKGVISPSILFHAVQNQTTLHVDIIEEPLRDVFFIFEGTDQTGNISVNVKVNPLIWFAWAGFIILNIGTVIAVWPKRPVARAA
ncbi:MAG: heme lyase CcmF/NrfE family subunit [Coriobacteriia bacterium]